MLKVNSFAIRLVVVYCPPKQNLVARFFDEFTRLLELLVVSPVKVCLVDDFDIHFDVPLDPVALRCCEVTISVGLTQHVVKICC